MLNIPWPPGRVLVQVAEPSSRYLPKALQALSFGNEIQTGSGRAFGRTHGGWGMITGDKTISGYEKVKQSEAERIPPRIVTTSWDDGDVCDFRIAEMLSARNLLATFYVPITGHHGPRALGRSGIQALVSRGFEIGAHGFSHLVLPHCTNEVIVHEVETSKQRLEEILASEVRMFAYPRGRYSSAAIRFVKKAGYAGARTTEMLAQGLNYDPYKMPTTIHVFPHSKSDYVRNTARAADVRRTWRYLTRLWQADTWVELAEIMFDSILAEGGVFHLYGHSWEIDELNLWDDLEKVLEYVSNRDGVRYLPNGDVLDYRIDKPCLHLADRRAIQG
jgi:peptidoglycan-N-acetylglucosamine deacetylase